MAARRSAARLTAPNLGGARLSAARVRGILELRPLPQEGGAFRETYRDGRSTAILYLLEAPDCSLLHRLSGPELYHWHAGAPLSMLLLHPDGRAEDLLLGPDLEAGQQPQSIVPGGVWQGSRPLGPDGAWTLVGTTMAPPFRAAMFELGDRDRLVAGWPAAEDRIRALTRGGPGWQNRA